MLAAIYLFSGIVLLFIGAEGLVHRAALLAKMFGVSSLVVGLTVVAYGTSFPELVVSCYGAYTGKVALSLGNVIGSNIFNILFILGMSAAISPLFVDRQIIRFDCKIMVGASLLFWLIGLNSPVMWQIGLLLLLGMAIYTYILVRLAKKGEEEKDSSTNMVQPKKGLFTQFVLIIIYLAVMIAGSDLFVRGAVMIAQFLGVSELVIGLTIVAAGTSLPEVATSIVAALKKEGDIAVGNIVGSNIFNLLGVVGTTILFSKERVTFPSKALSFDIPVMIAASLASLLFFISGKKVTRLEGILLLTGYAAYIFSLIAFS